MPPINLQPARFRLPLLLALAVSASPLHALDAADLDVHASGWLQYGRIGHSTDSIPDNYKGNSVQTSGAQISLGGKISDRLAVTAGVGVEEYHYLAGSINTGGQSPLIEHPFITQADFTYSFRDEDGSKLKLTGGMFNYDYNPDVQNLGLYLLRGPVYPGILISGFEIKPVLPVANLLGFRLQNTIGNFEQNFLINSETDLYPFFDLSPAYVADYHFGSVLRIGAGANFYRLLAIENRLTSPSNPEQERPYVDTATNDTTYISYRGTKLMADFSFDPKLLFGGSDLLGPEDCKLYGEAALIGLNNSAAYRAIYGPLSHRMPVMMGFNVPAFNFLDHLALEVEWYGATFRDDLINYVIVPFGASKALTPVPVASTHVSGTRDNWKWSLHGAKTIQKHLRLSFQVANDHFRPGGSTYLNPTGEVALSTPKDWYWMTKIAYFF